MHSNTLSNKNSSATLKEGVLGQNGIFVASWHANYWEKGGIHLDFWKYKYKTRTVTYIFFNGQLHLWPSWSYNVSSYYNFQFSLAHLNSHYKNVNFHQHVGTAEVDFTSSDRNSYPVLGGGFYNANFITFIGNQPIVFNVNKNLE